MAATIGIIMTIVSGSAIVTSFVVYADHQPEQTCQKEGE